MRGNITRAQIKLLEAISEPSCDFKPPRIPLDEDLEEIDTMILELVGDAAIHLSVVKALHNMYPEESADIFMHLRSAVNSNKTFFFLMKKAGLCYEPTTKYSKPLKYVSNGFEIRIGIFILQEGLPSLCSWVEKAFGPLIRACIPDMLQIKADAASAANPTYIKKRSRDDAKTSEDEL
ncbi:hypothetical protein FIBSPDRAFT_954224 [Athelia psychrophila]|uniref:RNase III domain-containing protein n=1 Tax=Athelia psychrophila TaxID=1759441 RepID=A0A166JF19_9AGAM|nr:hypothetical protein FIBSPDRAFT_954224 [Fibularhizoctonia sp. CBS 109695]